MLCLIQFFNDWKDFRLAELEALLQLYDLPPLAQTARSWSVEPDQSFIFNEVFLLVELPNREVAASLARRSVNIKLILELWSQAQSPSLLSQTICLNDSSFMNDYCRENSIDLSTSSWCVSVNAYCRTLTSLEQEQYRNSLGGYCDILLDLCR